MNKMIKLPLFLGISGGICAGLLAAVYSLTNPVIVKNAENKANAAYFTMFADYGDESNLTIDKTLDVSSELQNAGVSVKASVEGGSLSSKGMVYTCAVNGFAGKVEFQIAFANGKYLAYTNLANTESKPAAITYLSNADNINTVAASQPLSTYKGYTDATSGASVTGKALSGVIDLCAADYVASL